MSEEPDGYQMSAVERSKGQAGRIGLDFDGTLTAAPGLWRLLVVEATAHGWDVVCVTARRDTSENRQRIEQFLAEHSIEIPIYFTNLASKVATMQRIGLPVDVWIDDDPMTCAMGM